MLAGCFNIPSEGDAHEDDEELEDGVLQISKKPCAIPEYLGVVLRMGTRLRYKVGTHKCIYKEDGGLGAAEPKHPHDCRSISQP